MEDLTFDKNEKIKIFIKEFRYWLAFLIFVLVFGIGYWFFVKNLFNDYKDNLFLSAKLQSNIVLAQKQLNQRVANSQNLYQLSPEERRVLNMALPENLEHSSLVEHLTVMAQRSGFVVSNMSFEDVVGNLKSSSDKNELGKMSIKLKLAGGDYGSLRNFVDLIEKSIMVIDVLSVNFNSNNPTYEVVLMTYYHQK